MKLERPEEIVIIKYALLVIFIAFCGPILIITMFWIMDHYARWLGIWK